MIWFPPPAEKASSKNPISCTPVTAPLPSPASAVSPSLLVSTPSTSTMPITLLTGRSIFEGLLLLS